MPKIWGMEAYREANSPGLENVDRFIRVMTPPMDSSVIDVGCGTGAAGLELARHGLDTYWMDITEAGLDSAVPRERFFEFPLWSFWGNGWDFGFCCDVLEHIPPEYTMLCLDRILDAVGVAWLQIDNQPDKFGPMLLGQPLHLTVQPYSWWLVRLGTLGKVIDARDLCGVSLFVVTK